MDVNSGKHSSIFFFKSLKSTVMSVGNILYDITTLPVLNPSLLFYGPTKPHFGHLYGRPNFLHFPQRLIRMSPQLGQRNFVASAPGETGLLQLVHTTKVKVAALSAIRIPR